MPQLSSDSQPTVPRDGRRRGLRALLWAVAAGLLLVGVAATAGSSPSSSPSPSASPSDSKTDNGTPRGDGNPTVVLPPATPVTVTDAVSFVATGQSGGGFQNVLAVHPDGTTMLLGADNAGLHLSQDGGQSWMPRNSGLPDIARKVAAVAFSPTDPELAVAGVGFEGSLGGVLRSRDRGLTWELVTEEVRFSGQNNPNVPSLPNVHPRSTGALLVFAQNGTLLAGSFRDGVWRSDDAGTTWTSLGLRGLLIRGIALDEASTPSRLWVATHGAGLRAIDDPLGASPTAASLDGRTGNGPSVVEEVAVESGGTVVVAAGAEGVLRRAADGRWTTLHRTSGQITTIAAADGRIWAAGTDMKRIAGRERAAIIRSDDGGATWTTTSTREGVSTTVFGTDDLPLWIADAHPAFFPPGSDFGAGQLLVDQLDPDVVRIAGQMGMWVTQDAGVTWRLSAAGLAVTANDQTVVEPATGIVVVANTDFRALLSDDGMASVVAVKLGATKGLAVAADPTAAIPSVLIATGHRDKNTLGRLYRVPVSDAQGASLLVHPSEGGPAVAGEPATAGERVEAGAIPLGLEDVTGGERPLAVAAGLDASGRAVVLVAVEEAGVWRLVDGTWSQVATAAMAGPQRSPDAVLAWPLDGQLVWLLDRATGVWRSDDAGITWTNVLRTQSTTTRADRTGFLVVQPDDPTRVWVSTMDGLFLLNGGGVFEVDVRDIDGPSGPDRAPGAVLATEDGALWVATRGADGDVPELLVSCDAGSSFRSVADDAYRNAAGNVADLDLLADGRLLVTNVTQGTLVTEARLPRCDVG